MQPTNQLLGVQFRVGIRLVTNAVSLETLLISDFLSHRIILPIRLNFILIWLHTIDIKGSQSNQLHTNIILQIT